LRSFGTESDYFVDATIVSSPGNSPPIGNFSKSVNRQSQSLLPGPKLKDEQPSAAVARALKAKAPSYWVVSQDDALVGEEQLNIPLVFMQFALQSIIKSGKLCINCHENLGSTCHAALMKFFIPMRVRLEVSCPRRAKAFGLARHG
jgi:hypothetical protein